MIVLRNLDRNYIPCPSHAIHREKFSLDPVHSIPFAFSMDGRTYEGSRASGLENNDIWMDGKKRPFDETTCVP